MDERAFPRLIIFIIIVAILIFSSFIYWINTAEKRAISQIISRAKKYKIFKIRGVYATPASWPYKEDIIRLLDRLNDSGFNLLIWFVNPRGKKAFYMTKYYPVDKKYFLSGDPFRFLISEAHKRGIKVWAWFDFMGYRQLLVDHPDWGVKYWNGTSILEKPYRGYYPLNPANREVVSFWKNVLKELVTNYNIDGINFEDDYGYSYGGEYFSYDNINRELFTKFLKKHDIEELNWPNDALPGGKLYNLWIAYKCEIINNLSKELYYTVKEIRPSIEISLAVNVNLNWTKKTYGVDWLTLAKEGHFDYLTFMLYTADDKWLVEKLRYIKSMLNDTLSKPIIIIGWELRNKRASAWIRQALLIREEGYNDIIIFWAGGLENIKDGWKSFKMFFGSMKKI